MWSVWFVFCDCGFRSVCPLMEKDNRLMEASRWERLTGGKLGLLLMGGVMLNKSLIQFSFEGQTVFPPCYLTWGQTMVEVMKIMETSFKRSHAGTATLTAPSPAAGHHRPTPPLKLLDTHGQVWVSHGVTAPFSCILMHTRFCLCPPRVPFPSPV